MRDRVAERCRGEQERALRKEQCRCIADLADPTDSQREIRERLAAAGVQMSRRQLERRIQAMERDLGLEPTPPAERALARFHGGERRSGAIARRWRRHCL